MTPYFGQYKFDPSKTTHMNDISQKWEKLFHTCVTFIAYILCNDQ